MNAIGKTENGGPPAFYLTEIGLENFKPHENLAGLKLKPITLLIGPNSSGKTTLFQPILMLKQSFTREAKTIEPVSLNGDIINLGSFSNIVFDHDVKKEVRIKLVIENKSNDSRRILFDLSISYDKEKERMFLSKVSIMDLNEGLGLNVAGGQMTTFNRKGKIAEMQSEADFSISSLDSLLIFGLAMMIGGGKGKVKIKSDILGKKEFSKKEIESFASVSSMISMLSMTFQRITYVGPLREYPQRYYQTSGERFFHVGKRGERAIEIICSEGILGRNEIQCKLAYWLKALGVAHDIRLEKIGKGGGLYALILKTPLKGIEVNVADVGFGVSQIVPIIVETCLLQENDTVILEQPEIHLHPLGQMTMADMIIEAANQGRRFIIESHSEHFLLRLQRRIAEGKISPDQVAVYYFEPTKDKIAIREIKLAANGQFEDLPSGFMDERLEEAYSMATTRED